MSAPSSDSGPPISLLRFLAVGRLVVGSDGRWSNDGKHQLLCFQSAPNDNSVKSYKAHIKAIMNKGASKLQAGKRIRLTSDNNDYDLQVLADHINDNDTNNDETGTASNSQQIQPTLIFFAVTDPSFGKHHPVSSLLKDFKLQFYDTFSSKDLTDTQDTNSYQKAAQPFLSKLFSLYSVSRLYDVQVKVDRVKHVMKENVEKALNNVEHLEELEVKSEQFQEHAKQFNKNSNKLKNMFRCRYYKITALLFLLVCAVVGYIIYAIYAKLHG